VSTLIGLIRFRFHDGMVDEFKRLAHECTQVVRELDRGTLRYEMFLNADETEAIVFEEYVDEQAMIDHAAHIGEALSAAISATGTVHGEYLGELSDDYRARLAGGPVQAFSSFVSRN